MSARAALLLVAAAAHLGCEAPVPPRDPTTPITAMSLRDMVVEVAPGSAERASPTQGLGRGPILLHFWATWCAPCRRELPALLEANRAESRVTLVAVSNENWEDLDAYFEGQIPAPIARDPEGRLAGILGVSTLPETYLLDVDLVARRRAAGPVDWSDARVRSWLSELAGRAGE